MNIDGGFGSLLCSFGISFLAKFWFWQARLRQCENYVAWAQRVSRNMEYTLIKMFMNIATTNRTFRELQIKNTLVRWSCKYIQSIFSYPQPKYTSLVTLLLLVALSNIEVLNTFRNIQETEPRATSWILTDLGSITLRDIQNGKTFCRWHLTAGWDGL